MPRVWNKRDLNCPFDAVYVGRPSQWGNPFRIGVQGMTRASAIAAYRRELLCGGGLLGFNVCWVRQHLRGRDLVCWCAPLPCHADILLEVANGD